MATSAIMHYDGSKWRWQILDFSKSNGLSLFGIFRNHSIFVSVVKDFGALKMCAFSLPRYPDLHPTTKQVPGMAAFGFFFLLLTKKNWKQLNQPVTIFCCKIRLRYFFSCSVELYFTLAKYLPLVLTTSLRPWIRVAVSIFRTFAALMHKNFDWTLTWTHKR